MYTHIYLYMYKYICIHIYLHIYIHLSIQRIPTVAHSASSPPPLISQTGASVGERGGGAAAGVGMLSETEAAFRNLHMASGIYLDVYVYMCTCV